MTPFSSLSSYLLPTPAVVQYDQSGQGSNLNQLASRVVTNTLHSFDDLFSSTPVLMHTNAEVQVHVQYYLSTPSVLNVAVLNCLGDYLSTLFGKPVVLHLVRVKYPYSDPTVLSQYLSNELKLNRYPAVMTKLFNSVSVVTLPNVPADLVAVLGLKVQVAGRLPFQTMGPRMTVQTEQVGSFQSHRKAVVTYGHCTSINAKGSYTVKVWLTYGMH